jgi:hypothetical protein
MNASTLFIDLGSHYKHTSSQVLPLLSAMEFLPVLACQDRRIRIISGSKVMHEIPTPTAPTAVRYVMEVHDPTHRSAFNLGSGIRMFLS